MVVSAFLSCRCACSFLGPVRQADCRRYLCLRISGSEDHKIIARQLDPVEWRVIVLDDLTDVQTELFQGRIAAGFFLKLGEADLPLWLASAVLAADFIQPALKWATQAEIVVRDRYDIVGRNRSHEPIREDDLAIIEPPYPFFLHDKSGFVHEAENPDFAFSTCANRRGELCPL